MEPARTIFTYVKPQLGDATDASSDGQITNGNTLYLHIGSLCYESVMEIMKRLTGKAQDYLEANTKLIGECKYKVNIPCNKEGVPFGFAYCWITNQQMYNILIGLNPDGTERCKYVEIESELAADDWAACTETKKIPLPPIVGRYKKEYDEAEFLVAKKAVATRLNKELCQIFNNEVADSYTVSIGRAIIYEVKPDFQPNVLCASRLPPWVSCPMVKDVMTTFAVNSPDLDVSMIVSKETRTVMVTFNRTSNDAAFVLQMVRKVVIRNGDQKYEAIFSHAAVETEREASHGRRGGGERGRGGGERGRAGGERGRGGGERGGGERGRGGGERGRGTQRGRR